MARNRSGEYLLSEWMMVLGEWGNLINTWVLYLLKFEP
jgi:hypothetical protein